MKEEEIGIVIRELDRSSEEMAAPLTARLDRARRHAVSRGLVRNRWSMPFLERWVLAGAGAAIALLLVFSVQDGSAPLSPVAQEVEEFEILTAQEQLDVVKDQEFYRWLMEQEAVNSRREG